MKTKVYNIGGQAVIEGVMMKSRGGWTVAVRDQKGEIHLKVEQLKMLPRFLRLPFIRGIIALYQAFSIGIKAIEFSAGKALNEEEKPMSPLAITATIVFALLLGVGLFVLLPLYATKLMGLFSGIITESSFVFNLVDGILRVLIFLAYILAIGLWKDMRRIFEYHGAEHKVIHAYEAGKELDLKNIRLFSPQHPRCGTSFLLIVMVMSIIVFSFIPQSWPFASKFLSRLILIPAIAGISYEIQKLSTRMKDNPFVNLLILPGLLLQKMTTKEPDDSQIEVAVAALREAIRLEAGDVR
ncbi:MAG: DUF1385 domain-containing protein [Nitrospirota bacterium]